MTDITREQHIAGLRALADLMEKHPDIAAPYQTMMIYMSDKYDDDYTVLATAKEQMRAWRKAAGGTWSKHVGEYDFTLRGTLEGMPMELKASRYDVCKRVVVGTKKEMVEEASSRNAVAGIL